MITCNHPIHQNPTIITPCPDCGESFGERPRVLQDELKNRLLDAGWEIYRSRHPSGDRVSLGDCRSLNSYYKTQDTWWISPNGEIMHWKDSDIFKQNARVEVRQPSQDEN